MTSSAPAPVADVLTAMAGEASSLVRMADDLQAAIAALSAGLTTAPPEALVGCQAADMLSQRLSGLAQYLDRLAVAAPQGVVIDAAAAARGLPLADQAASLGGWAPVCEPDPGGELELFDVQL